MAIHDYVLDNDTGANFRADLNNALAAIVSNNSSSTQPTTRYAYQWWADTNEGVLKIRNSANDGWVTLLQLDGTLTLEDGSSTAPALGFRDDLNTGIFSSAADTLDITCGGTTRGSFSSSGLTVTGNVTATTFVGNVDAVDGDFDGTLEADAITVAGTALSTVIAGTTVTTETNANHISVADNESTNENNLIPFIEDASATGNVGLESDGDFTYNPSTGTVTATVFVGNLTGNVTGNVTGNADSADTIDVTASGTDSSFALTFVATSGSAKSLLCDTSGIVFNPYSNTLTTGTFNGSGASLSDVNAATLDGIDSTSFLRSDAADSASGLLTLSGGISLTGKAPANITSVTQSSGTITFDFSASCHHKVTLTQTASLAAPSNQEVGQSGSIFITQPSSGNFACTYNSAFFFTGGSTPTLSTSSSAVDRIDYVVFESNKIHCVVSLDVKTGT